MREVFETREDALDYAHNQADLILSTYFLSEDFGHNIPFSLVNGIYFATQENLKSSEFHIPFDRILRAYGIRYGFKDHFASSFAARLHNAIRDPTAANNIKEFGDLVEAAAKLHPKLDRTQMDRGEYIKPGSETSRTLALLASEQGISSDELVSETLESVESFFNRAETARRFA